MEKNKHKRKKADKDNVFYLQVAVPREYRGILQRYCDETGLKQWKAILNFIDDGILKHEKEKMKKE